MSTEDQEREAGTAVTVGDRAGSRRSKRKLEMQVDISDVGPCKKHVKVSIPRSEIERQLPSRSRTSARRSPCRASGPGALPANW